MMKKVFQSPFFTLGLLFSITILLTSPSIAASGGKTYKFTCSYWGTMDEGEGIALQHYFTAVDKGTNGAVKVTIYPSGSLTTQKQSYAGVVAGISDLALFMFNQDPGRFPMWCAQGVPLGIKTNYESIQLTKAVLNQYHLKELQDTKMISFGAEAPTLSLLLKNKPVYHASDFKGLKIRATGTSGRIIRVLGGSPVAMGIGEIYGALDKNVIDATCNSWAHLKTYQFAEIVKYVLPLKFFGGSGWALVMNKGSWNSLSPEYQKIMTDLAPQYQKEELELKNKSAQEGVDYGKAKGVQFLEPSAQMLSDLEKVYGEVRSETAAALEKKGLPGNEYIKFMQEIVAGLHKK